MKPWAVDVSQTASAASIVFDALRKAIIRGELAVGEPLRQDEIARLFNTSRIPVREAISKLEELGLVKTQRYKGAVVSDLSADEAAQIFDFRALVEPEIIRQAVPHMTAALLDEADGYCRAFSRSPDPMQWGDLNRAFHSTLYSASRLEYHRQMADKAMDRVDVFLRAQILLSDGMARADREHGGILEACARGDAEAAATLTADHILGAKETLLAQLDILHAR